MDEPTTAIRHCDRGDLAATAAVLGAAFRDDPVISWMFGDTDRRDDRIEQAFATWLRRIHLPKGGVWADGRSAAACWAPPARWQLGMTQQLRLLPSMASIFGIGRLPQVLSGLQTMAERHRDDRPHWYCNFLGTRPDQQGQGHGSALLADRLRACDARGEPAYLEASAPGNVPFYERFGFEVVETFALPDGPPVTTMWREPR